MIQGIASIVVGLALEPQIRRGQCVVELLGSGVELPIAIGRGPCVEMQTWIISLALEQLLVFLERLVVFARFVFSEGARGRSECPGWQQQQQQKAHRSPQNLPAL